MVAAKYQSRPSNGVFTITLCHCASLTDEQAAECCLMLGGNEYFEAFYNSVGWQLRSIEHELRKDAIYRIKQKSERELFIEKTTKVMRDAGTKCPDNHEYFGIMFDAGARYKDLTQFFGESI